MDGKMLARLGAIVFVAVAITATVIELNRKEDAPASSPVRPHQSVDELAKIAGRAQSNVSRTLKTMAGHGLIRMEKGRGLKLTPKLAYDRIELVLPLTAAKAPQKVKRGQQ